ncbi:unnamed protein product [Rhodiola kirilowii]
MAVQAEQLVILTSSIGNQFVG